MLCQIPETIQITEPTVTQKYKIIKKIKPTPSLQQENSKKKIQQVE